MLAVKPLSVLAVNFPDPAATAVIVTLLFASFLAVNTSGSLDVYSTSVVAVDGVKVTVKVSFLGSLDKFKVVLSLPNAICVAGTGSSVASTTALANGQIANVLQACKYSFQAITLAL